MPSSRRAVQGFTLIELLVSLAVMALLALMSWRGVAGMVSAQTQLRERVDGVATLQVGLTQWSADLNAVMETGVVDAVDYDGRVLRLTRHDTGSEGSPLRVVGWTRRVVTGEGGTLGRWTRWQSPQIETRSELQSAWSQARQWAQSAGTEPQPGEVAVVALADWQIFYFRNNAWSNPLSSADTVASAVAGTVPSVSPGTATGTAPLGSPLAGRTDEPTVRVIAPLPEGIRLVLDLSAGQAVTGRLTKDWILPIASRVRS